jgi:hypothetical protein
MFNNSLEFSVIVNRLESCKPLRLTIASVNSKSDAMHNSMTQILEQYENILTCTQIT